MVLLIKKLFSLVALVWDIFLSKYYGRRGGGGLIVAGERMKSDGVGERGEKTIKID